MVDEEIARFYTRSRRFPKMIGRMTDGSRIPGGPYTLTQVGFGGAALLILLMSRTAWSTGAVIVDLIIAAAVAGGIIWLVGLIPMTRRNIGLAVVDGVAAMFKPHGGTYQGRRIQLARPHRAHGTTQLPHPPVVVDDSSADAAQSTPTVPPLQVITRPAPPVAHPTSGVERLLQQAKSK